MTALATDGAEPSVCVMSRRAYALALVLLLLCALAPSVARADGDPGSDVLVFQDLFVGSDAGLSVRQQVQLGNLLQAAGRTGVPVRVAIIARTDDLGAVTALWRRPQTRARCPGIELALAYQQRLLVVMPNGFGINWPGHSSAPSYAVLSRISITPGGSGLLRAAQNAVRALATAAGVKLGQSEPTRGGPRPALGASRSDGSASGRGDLVIVDERSRDARAAAGGSLRALLLPGSRSGGASCAGRRHPLHLREQQRVLAEVDLPSKRRHAVSRIQPGP